MGQDSTWHLQQLNQYVSIFNSSLSGSSSGGGDVNSNGDSHHHHNHHQQQQRLTAAAASQFTSTATTSGGTAAAQSTTLSVNFDDGTATIIWNNWLLLLIILYCIVVFGGIFGNASLVITLYTQSSTRLRNPLLVALCLADLMVTGVAAPLTVVSLVLMVRRSWSHSLVYACKSIYFMQVSLINYIFNNKKLLCSQSYGNILRSREIEAAVRDGIIVYESFEVLSWRHLFSWRYRFPNMTSMKSTCNTLKYWMH